MSENSPKHTASTRTWPRRAAVAVVAILGISAIGITLLLDHHSTPARGRAAVAERLHVAPGAITGALAPSDATMTVCARHAGDPPHCTLAATTYALENLSPGDYTVYASLDGHGSAPAHTTVAPDARVRVDLAIATTGDSTALVHGTVHDRRAAPIRDAQVELTGAAQTVTAVTDAAGNFTGWLPPGDVTARVAATGYIGAKVVGLSPGMLDVTLEPAGTIAGTVIYASTGTPVASADVEAGGEHATSDAEGHFLITKLSAGRYQPSATALGGYGEAGESVLVPLGRAVANVTIVVHPVAVVTGRVVLPTGAGCPAGTGHVSLSQYGGRATYLEDTLDDGAVVVSGVLPGRYDVVVQCAGWTPLVPYPDVVVADADVEDVAWPVLAGARVTGMVTDRSKRPIDDASLAVLSPTDKTVPITRSDAAGNYAITGVTPGAFELDVRAAGFVSSPRRPGVASVDTPTRIDVVLDRGATITGDVVDDTGAPVANASIDAKPIASASDDHGNGRTDPRGAFQIDELAGGRYELRADLGWGDAASVVDVTVAPGGSAATHMVVARDAGAVTGIVRNADNQPVPDVNVAAAREDADGSRGIWGDTVITGDDGRFTISHLPAPAQYSVRAEQPGAGQAIAVHVAANTDIALSLRPTGAITGVVVTADGKPPDDVLVRLTARGKLRGEVDRDEHAFHTDGRFTFRDLPAGDYRLGVDGDPGSTQYVTIGESDRREVRLVVHPRFSIRGRLVSARDRSPLAGWRVTAPQLELVDDNPDEDRHIKVYTTAAAVTRGDGQFVIHDLPETTTTLSVARPDAADDTPLRDVALAGSDVDLGDVPVAPPQ
jgi:hypothetical protein